ncbi:MAG: serine hydrolase [Gammaproteobacteria bacterium]|nr:serine hydrolase [Gammaproteobacteria bacterium]
MWKKLVQFFSTQKALLRPVLQFSLLGCLVVHISYSVADERMDYVSDRLDSAVEHEFIGGAVVGSYDSGEVQFFSKGRISQESETSPNETTLFEIGSITKVFTAALTQSLVDSEVLSWDSSVESSLEDWRIVNKGVREISLRELATHSSGLPRMPLNWQAMDELDPYLGYDAKLLQAFISEFNPTQLKKELVYSNVGFGLLGFIAANSAGKSYTEALRERVLDPLGMHSTRVGLSDESRTNLARGFALGAIVPNWNFDSLEGAGAILSTAEDLMQFVGKNVEPDDSLISKALQQLLKVQVPPNQAFGWVWEQGESDQPIFWHAGLTGGYACFLAISPEESKGWVVLTTSLHGGLVTEIGRSFFTPLPNLETAEISAYLGVYRISENFHLTFRSRDNRLLMQATGQSEVPLTFVETGKYKSDAAGIVLTFEEPTDGKSQNMEFVQGGQTINTKRVDDKFGIPNRNEIEIDNETLEDYQGVYQLAPTASFSVVLREGQLFATLTGQPTMPIFPMDQDRFFYKQVDAEVLFERDADGLVSSLTLIQGRELKAPKVNEGGRLGTPSPPSTSNRANPPRRSSD